MVVENRPDLVEQHAASMTQPGRERRLLSIVDRDQLRRILQVMLDPNEFLSDSTALPALSTRDTWPSDRCGRQSEARGTQLGELRRSGFLPTGAGRCGFRELLLIEGLQRYHYYSADQSTVECPTGSGQYLTLGEVAQELSRRLTRIFLPDTRGRGRPVNGSSRVFQEDPHWRDLALFYEYFNGDTGEGLGASHQGLHGARGQPPQQSAE